MFLSTILTGVLFLGTLAGIAFLIHCGIVIPRNIEYRYVKMQDGKNDDATALKELLKMVEEAEESLIMYDDGDAETEDSIYDDPQLIDAVEKKLEKNPSFKIQCLFNSKDSEKLEFCKKFAENSQVQIKCLARDGDDRPKDDVHYKVIDQNRKAYLSSHELGASERVYNIVDCTDCLPRYREYFLGKYNKHIQEKRQKAI